MSNDPHEFERRLMSQLSESQRDELESMAVTIDQLSRSILDLPEEDLEIFLGELLGLGGAAELVVRPDLLAEWAEEIRRMLRLNQ